MTLKSIENWQRQARPEISERDISVAIGVHFEEIAEMLNALRPHSKLASMFSHLGFAALMMDSLASDFKSGAAIDVGDREGVLDALGDQIVTAVGVGYCLGMDVPEAVERIDKSNWSKFVDGKPIKDANGKIIKGPDYKKVNLEGLY